MAADVAASTNQGADPKVLTCDKAAPNADSYHNQACATAQDSLAGDKGTVSHCDDVTTQILKPAFTITKTVSPSGDVHVGDNLHYTITVTNTGNTGLDFSLSALVFGSDTPGPATAGCDNYAPDTPETFHLDQGAEHGVEKIDLDDNGEDD